MVVGTGLKTEIKSVAIGADLKPVVTFTLTDAKGNVLNPATDLEGLTFVFGYLKEDKDSGITMWLNHYTNDKVSGADYVFNGQTVKPALATATQPIGVSPDRTKLTRNADGTFTFAFPNPVVADYDKNATHRMAAFVYRENRASVVNPIYDFVPAGGEPQAERIIVTKESCNRCHDPLGAHGGVRRDTRLCVLCHTPQNTDPETGNTVEFKQMVHKIHRGENLPSVEAGQPYFIVGFRQNVFDASTIAWPQDIRNCTTCHGAPPPGMKAEDYAKLAPQADNYKTAPNRAACGACHDNIDFATGKARFGGRDHPGGPQADDKLCSLCHQSSSGKEFDASILGAHTIPENSVQVKGVVLSIVSVSNTGPGQNPTVVFNIKDKAGTPIAAGDMDYLAFTLAGPTTDYAKEWNEPAVVKPPLAPAPMDFSQDAGGGNFSYTFNAAIPAEATGTYAVGMEGMRAYPVFDQEGKPVMTAEGPVVFDAGDNPVVFIPVTDVQPVVRRTVIKEENCNQCHQDLGNPAGIAIHGGIRRNTEYCVLCHNATHTDEGSRPAEAMPPQGVQFKYLVHSIHKGEERADPFSVWGFGGREFSFAEVRFPGDLRNCNKCHEGNSYTLPLPEGVLPMTVTQAGEVVSVTQPVAAACTACHASQDVAAHADTMTTSKGAEACAVCHGRGLDFAVEKVHAR
ncbi:MAG: OmcA/MtrC family decaheme c-type cytochrome [Chloroflexi bacterium]|nr:OmcA/MtrC family decaheme c-type cytochrome [Chloroflexota bacterium]